MGTLTSEDYIRLFKQEIESYLDRKGLSPRTTFNEASATCHRVMCEFRGTTYAFRWTVERRASAPTRVMITLARHSGLPLVWIWQDQTMEANWIVTFGADKEPDTRHFKNFATEGILSGTPVHVLIKHMADVAKNGA